MKPQQFDAGVLGFAPQLRAFLRRRVNSPAVADDLAQETLLKVYRSRATLRDDTKLEAWLYQIARGVLIDHFRRQRPQAELPADLTDEDAAAPDPLRAQIARTITRFLADLPPAYREPLRLAEMEGLPLARVALRLDLSLAAVKSRVQRGRALLKKKLQACCRFEVDARGHLIDYERHRTPCCETPPEPDRPTVSRSAGLRVDS